MPPSRLEFRKQFKAEDFVFDLNGTPSTSTGGGGKIRANSVDNFPALSGEGISYSLFDVEPCGVNLPHVHPRATELLYVISGNFLRTGFVEGKNDFLLIYSIIFRFLIIKCLDFLI